MKLPSEGVPLRIFVGEDGTHSTRDNGFRGEQQDTHGQAPTEDLPVVIGVVATQEKIRRIPPFLDGTVKEGR